MLLEFLLTPITTVHYGLNSYELLAVCARACVRACVRARVRAALCTFGSSNLVSTLRGSGIECPAIDEQLLARWAKKMAS